MLEKTPFTKSNPQLGLINGIMRDTNERFRESRLSHSIRWAVENVFLQASDKSLFSLVIESLILTDELQNTLSPSDYRFLLSLDLDNLGNVLDLTQDFGGVTHYLADQASSVDSIKIDIDKARLSKLRCANKHNVCHISADLESLNFPATHYQFIVIGKLEDLDLSITEIESLLAKLRNSLSASGQLLINVKNSKRINRWFVRHQDPDSFAELYESDNDGCMDYLQTKTLIAHGGFAHSEFYGTLSSIDSYNNLFSQHYLNTHPNAINHCNRIGVFQQDGLNELLFFRNRIDHGGILLDDASRFLVCAAENNDSARQRLDLDFCHYPGFGRKPEWRCLTLRRHGAPMVEKKALYPHLKSNSAVLVQNRSKQHFQKGRLLIESWLDACRDLDVAAFRTLLTDYKQWLQTQNQTELFDLLPFNIIVDRNNTMHAIDKEWQYCSELDLNYVLFRALFWFSFENQYALATFAKYCNADTLELFVVEFLDCVSQPMDLHRFVKLEEQAQKEISHNFKSRAIANALSQRFDQQPPRQTAENYCQVQWYSNDQRASGVSTISENWLNVTDLQTRAIDITPYQNGFPILRIDPTASIQSIEDLIVRFFDNDHLLKVDSLVDAQAVNLTYSTEANRWVPVNEDPHFFISLEKEIDIQKTNRLEIELRLEATNKTDAGQLRNMVENQNTILAGQARSLNRYRAEIAYLEDRLDNLLSQRSELSTQLNNLLDEKVNFQLATLNSQLIEQVNKNTTLEQFLMQRTSTRIKNFLSRQIKKLSKNTASEKLTAPAESVITPEAKQPLEQDLSVTDDPIGQNKEDYDLWINENAMSEADIHAARKTCEQMPLKPVFSVVVPIYNTDPEYLSSMIRSVQAQIYPHWELCLVDDASPNTYLKAILEYEASQDKRIKIQLNNQNKGISLTTNDAIAMASGDYIALLDHDDELSIDALYQNAVAINEHPNVGLLYSDEDKLDMQGNRLEPYFKPDFSPDLLDANNYICHFTVIRKTIIDDIGGFREGLDGSQDHDIILRAIQHTDQVVHIAKILYHWRKIPGSTAAVYDAKSYAWEAGRRAVEQCLRSHDANTRVKLGILKGTYQVVREISNQPLVSIIIPFKDRADLLKHCTDSIINRSTYENYQIIGVSNNSTEIETLSLIKALTDEHNHVSFIEKNIPFNFSSLCNYGVERAEGDYIVLLNNDVEIQSADWIERLLEHAQRPETGAVGGKLLYPDGRIQHAGVVIGLVGAAGHPHKFFPDEHVGYHGRLHMVHNVSAVTGAMLMVSKADYQSVDGLNEEQLGVAYNDVDFCLKLLQKGRFNVFTPHCRAIHHESLSRGYEDEPEKLARLKQEQDYFLESWSQFLEQGDPYYNPNLSLKTECFSLKFRD